MNNEIEATFLDIDKTKIRKQLKGLGAECIKPGGQDASHSF